jgi:hypothetical protein
MKEEAKRTCSLLQMAKETAENEQQKRAWEWKEKCFRAVNN